MVSIELLLNNVNRNRSRKNFISRFGKSTKAIDFYNAIEKLNNMYKTSFYMETSRSSFTIQGHREYGHLSRRNGILGNDVDLTFSTTEIKKVDDDTIKMIVDNDNNFIVISLTTMHENDQFSKENLKNRIYDGNKKIPYTWSLDELEKMNAIIYKSL